MRRVLLLLLLLPGLCQAATYTVSQSGGGDCTTINACAGRMQGGDTLIVKAGTYVERLVDVLPSGTPGAPTTLKSEPPLGAILLAPSDGCDYTLLISQRNSARHDIVVDGLVMDNANQFCANGVLRIGAFATCGDTYNITIQNSEARNLPVKQWPDGGAGMSAGACTSNVVFRNNHIHHIAYGYRGPDDNKVHCIYNSGDTEVIENNHIHHCMGFGIHPYNATGTSYMSNSIIRGNVIHDTTTRAGILVSSGDNWQVYNNIIYNAAQEGIFVGDYCTLGCNNAQIYNNTIYGNAQTCVIVGEAQNTKVRNNICYRNGTDAIVRTTDAQSSLEPNLLGTDPLFVNAAAGDFHLQAGSPARGTGVPMPDIVGNPPDQGATGAAGGDRPPPVRPPPVPPQPAPRHLRLTGPSTAPLFGLAWDFERGYAPAPSAFVITYTDADGQSQAQMRTPLSAPGACQAAGATNDTFCTRWPSCPPPGVVIFWVQASWDEHTSSARTDPLLVCLFTAEKPCVCQDPATYTPPVPPMPVFPPARA